MKKLLIFLPLVFFVLFPKSLVWADENGSGSAAVSPTPMVNDYTLPYPGLLPDNPLYFLKTLRDKMIVFFISDSLKKSAFYLLQSDKRLASSWYLLKKDVKQEDGLALSTLSKSTNYLSQSVDELKNAKEAGEDTGDMAGKITSALIKHAAVINDMIALPGLSNKGAFVTEEKRVLDLEKVVSKEAAQ